MKYLLLLAAALTLCTLKVEACVTYGGGSTYTVDVSGNVSR